jgi:hypothetical protein
VISTRALANLLRVQGGFTYSEVTGSLVTEGYAFSEDPTLERTFDHEVSGQTILSYCIRNSAALRQPENVLGAWLDRETGKTYLDVSTVVSDYEEAAARAKATNQLAVFDLTAQEEVRL